MKQHILTTQLNELSEKGKEKLRKWSDERDYYQEVEAPSTEIRGAKDVWCEPLLSIGQMIEFLDEQEQFSSIRAMMKKLGSDYYWEVDANLMGEFDNEDLCDALWSAVKEVLDRTGKK